MKIKIIKDCVGCGYFSDWTFCACLFLTSQLYTLAMSKYKWRNTTSQHSYGLSDSRTPQRKLTPRPPWVAWHCHISSTWKQAHARGQVNQSSLSADKLRFLHGYYSYDECWLCHEYKQEITSKISSQSHDWHVVLKKILQPS